jgi:tetratricopeptide (TPR) repeat protein
MLEAEFPLPDWNSVWNYAACVLRGSGFPDEARSIGKAMVAWYEALPVDEQRARIAMVTVANGHDIADNLEEAEHFCSILNQETPTSFLGTLGVLAARRGDREEAMEWSRRLEENGRQRGKFDQGSTQFNQALIAAQLGDLDRAMDLLREAYRRGRDYMAMYFYPELEPLKDHPQYEEFMRPKK